MKILLIADHEERSLWDYWSAQTAQRLSDVDLILSAGDLDANYLEFLVTMLNAPLVYVHGNHDTSYLENPPRGCIDADGRIVEIKCSKSSELVRILGLGGSMRYKEHAEHMFSEREMEKRIVKLSRVTISDLIYGRIKGREQIDILLTHAPCKGYGDLDDLPHQGFACFNDLLSKRHPKLHVYGHIHKSYRNTRAIGSTADNGFSGFKRIIAHPSGTTLVNANSSYIFEY